MRFKIDRHPEPIKKDPHPRTGHRENFYVPRNVRTITLENGGKVYRYPMVAHTGKYSPHQGAQEKARRLKRIESQSQPSEE